MITTVNSVSFFTKVTLRKIHAKCADFLTKQIFPVKDQLELALLTSIWLQIVQKEVREQQTKIATQKNPPPL